jgi:hypothetical protein
MKSTNFSKPKYQFIVLSINLQSVAENSGGSRCTEAKRERNRGREIHVHKQRVRSTRDQLSVEAQVWQAKAKSKEITTASFQNLLQKKELCVFSNGFFHYSFLQRRQLRCFPP